MATMEAAPCEEVEALKYSHEYIASLLIYSFFFSQGDSPFQTHIFRYLATRFRDSFDTNLIDSAIEIASKRMLRMVNNPKVHKQYKTNGDSLDLSEDSVVAQAQTQGNRLSLALIDSEHYKDLLDVGHIARKAMAKDRSFLKPPHSGEGRGRDIRSGSSPFADNNLSQWVYFGLMRQPTGMPEYDQMFQEAVADYQAKNGYNPPDEFRQISDSLVFYHLSHHKEQVNLLPDWMEEKPYYQELFS